MKSTPIAHVECAATVAPSQLSDEIEYWSPLSVNNVVRIPVGTSAASVNVIDIEPDELTGTVPNANVGVEDTSAEVPVPVMVFVIVPPGDADTVNVVDTEASVSGSN